MDITPHTKLGALLDAHPELEDTLIAAVPAFVKLKNPILRATVAKLATLEQVAKVGGLPLPDLIDLIRKAVGQECGSPIEASVSSVLDAWPAWFRPQAVVAELAVAQILAEGGHPLSKAKQILNGHPPGTTVLLLSDFEPAPLLAQVRQEGWLAACLKHGDTYRTALRKP